MKVVIANDHGAVELVNRIIRHLESKNIDVTWLGTKTEDSVDYPDYALCACKEYLKGGYDFGIVCCGTGIGISISANKIHGIRCALVQDSFAARMTKEHNNANFLAFGGRIDYKESVESMIDAYMAAEVSTDPRHVRRVEKMMNIENMQ